MIGRREEEKDEKDLKDAERKKKKFGIDEPCLPCLVALLFAGLGLKMPRLDFGWPHEIGVVLACSFVVLLLLTYTCSTT